MKCEPIDRFLPKININFNGCWEVKTKVDRPIFLVNGRRISHHVYAYEYFKGPIPNGLHIDHLCNNGRCVRPDHLEAVTPAENNLRITLRKHEKLDHEYLPNTTGRCKICKNMRSKEYVKRNPEARSASLRKYRERSNV